MPVAQYIPRNEPALHAMFWQGREEDLAEMPGLDNSDVSFWVEDGLLYIHNLDEPEPNQIAHTNKHYVVRGVTGYFFVVEKETFERDYISMEVLQRQPMWTPEQARNVLGEPIYYFERAWVDYDRAANLCERIIGHYETRLTLAALTLILHKQMAAKEAVPSEVLAAIRVLMIHAAGGHEPPYDAPVTAWDKPSEFYIVSTWLDTYRPESS